MKNSPLQLGPIRYSDVVVHAVPELDLSEANEILPIQVEASVFYNAAGEHYAVVGVSQKSSAYPYLIEVSAFTMFSMDVDGCSEAYRQHFNPSVIGVNVVRMLYSSVRDMIASITARAPYETAKIPTLMIEPKDVNLHFESGGEEIILQKCFGINDEQLKLLRERKAELELAENAKPKKVAKVTKAKRVPKG